ARAIQICSRRRSIRLTLQNSGRPMILPIDLAVAHGPDQVGHWQQITERKNGRPRSGQYVEHLELRRIGVITPGHPQVAEYELREERQIEADKENNSREPGERFRIKLASNLGPPKMQAADVTHDRATDHDVVEVRDDEIGVVNVNVQAQAGKEESGEAANQKKADETEGVKHGRVPGNRTFRKRRGPVEDFDS